MSRKDMASAAASSCCSKPDRGVSDREVGRAASEDRDEVREAEREAREEEGRAADSARADASPDDSQSRGEGSDGGGRDAGKCVCECMCGCCDSGTAVSSLTEYAPALLEESERVMGRDGVMPMCDSASSRACACACAWA